MNGRSRSPRKALPRLEQFEGREDAAELAAILLTLDPSYREVLTLRFHEELSLEEIASDDPRSAFDGEVASLSRPGCTEAATVAAARTTQQRSHHHVPSEVRA